MLEERYKNLVALRSKDLQQIADLKRNLENRDNTINTLTEELWKMTKK